MSLNPVLQVPPGGPQALPPLPGEVYLLYRQGIEFSATIDSYQYGHCKFTARGAVLLSNVRILFIRSQPSVQHQVNFVSFDIPLRGISDCQFNQPIFSANNLTGKTVPVNALGSTTPVTWKCAFKEGGTGAFVPILLRLLSTITQQQAPPPMPPPPQAPMAPPPSVPIAQAYVVNAPSDPAHYQQLTQAYVDPSDPTVVLVSQPSAPPPPMAVAQPMPWSKQG